ncbi:MarR family winged helix-turn-helix transcriptional regulator [Bacillus kexueae]|uniref:MarR family winged helix-turn-helix transcriptional regulator n=1 Tax=Aeribacillus kexueae TaxID=2078952 RepID=UPI001FAF196C|nr:MarR family transcriptional regulator [Bacillus kexueae]
MKAEDEVLRKCLYFTSSRFTRVITKLAEEQFEHTGFSPTYLYLLITVKSHPGITQKELCEKLSIAPSTSTRFIDKLEKEDVVIRKKEGKETKLYLTEKGQLIYVEARKSLKKLYEAYEKILGRELSHALTDMLHEASEKLER